MVITPNGKEILISLEEMYQTLCMVNHWLTDPQTAEILQQEYYLGTVLHNIWLKAYDVPNWVRLQPEWETVDEWVEDLLQQDGSGNTGETNQYNVQSLLGWLGNYYPNHFAKKYWRFTTENGEVIEMQASLLEATQIAANRMCQIVRVEEISPDCPVCHGDCSAANPPMGLLCPLNVELPSCPNCQGHHIIDYCPYPPF